MATPRVEVVVTTINDGSFLETYAQAIRAENAQDHAALVVIPDLKSPPELYARCREMNALGIRVECPTVPEQDAFLTRLGGIQRLIPYNSDNRRNAGYLMALERGADIVVSVDDDNLPRADSGFFQHHEQVGQVASEEAVNSSDGWYNICDLLDVQPPTTYPRGFPYHRRHQAPQLSCRVEEGEVHVNAGLWLGHPDVDAIDCLASPVHAASFRGRSVLLGRDTWSPINSQNTAVARAAMAAYYFFKMGHPVLGQLAFERYGDIFSGYFVQACARHLGKRIRVGTPVVDHIRNSHDYMRDLGGELAGIWMLEELTDWLMEVRLQGGDYRTAYLCLADLLEDAVEGFKGQVWNDSARAYFHAMAYNMRAWVNAVAAVGAA
jgi:hypothetical protein